MQKNERIRNIIPILEELYPFDGTCFLDYDPMYPWQLLFATILSAQCTDACVNQVTPVLFEKFTTLEAFAGADISKLEQCVRKTGFYRHKANHLKQSAHILLTKFDGKLPSDIDALTSLSGVGRKTANVVRVHIFNLPGITTDTHVMRVSQRLGLTKNTDPVKIEHDLMKLLPKKHWMAYNHQIISHGRAICSSRAPKCDDCRLINWCKQVL